MAGLALFEVLPPFALYVESLLSQNHLRHIQQDPSPRIGDRLVIFGN